MNNLNFGRYIEDILTRMKDGDKDYKSMLPCYYVEKSDEVKECAQAILHPKNDNKITFFENRYV